MEVYGYKLWETWELTLPEVAIHVEKLNPTMGEPEWFVAAWRGAKCDRERLRLARAMLDGRTGPPETETESER